MLRNLMKYEFMAVGRILVPLYALWLFMSVLFNLALNAIISIPNLMIGIMSLVYTASAIAAVVLSIIMIIQRFYKNLLGAEGYLMLTMPVSINKHIWCKGISAAIWSNLGVITGLLSIGIITMNTADTFREIAMLLSDLWEIMGGLTLVVLAEILVIMMISGAETIMKIYASIAIGHLWTEHRILGAILVYIAIGIIEFLIFYPLGVFLSDVDGTSKAFWECVEANLRHMSEFGVIQVGFFATIAFIIPMYAIYHFVTYRMLKKRLNLE